MLKTPEAAERIGVSVDTLKRWRRATRRENRQIGPRYVVAETGSVFYQEDVLAEWIKDRTVVA